MYIAICLFCSSFAESLCWSIISQMWKSQTDGLWRSVFFSLLLLLFIVLSWVRCARRRAAASSRERKAAWRSGFRPWMR